MIEFKIEKPIPTTTAQQKGVRVVNGKPMFYKKNKVRLAENFFVSELKKHAPEQPFDKAVGLRVFFCFETKNKKRFNKFKTTKPDTDNLLKLLKDCMTKTGYFVDDSYVAYEEVSKYWVEKPYIMIQIWELAD